MTMLEEEIFEPLLFALNCMLVNHVCMLIWVTFLRVHKLGPNVVKMEVFGGGCMAVLSGDAGDENVPTC